MIFFEALNMSFQLGGQTAAHRCQEQHLLPFIATSQDGRKRGNDVWKQLKSLG